MKEEKQVKTKTMNSIAKKYIVSNLNSSESEKFNTEIEACDYIRNQELGEKYMILPSYESVEPASLKFRATIVLCVYKEPNLRILRAIDSCLAQTTTGIELMIYGDASPYLQELMNSGYFDKRIIEQQLKGNDIVVLNNERNYGGYGYRQRNQARELARGVYTMYVDGDDVILPNHVETRLAIAETDEYDLIGFETKVYPSWRDTQFAYGKIGHAEIIIRTSFLKTLPLSPPEYGHDWTMIEAAINASARRTIVQGEPRTYIIKSTPDHPEID